LARLADIVGASDDEDDEDETLVFDIPAARLHDENKEETTFSQALDAGDGATLEISPELEGKVTLLFSKLDWDGSEMLDVAQLVSLADEPMRETLRALVTDGNGRASLRDWLLLWGAEEKRDKERKLDTSAKAEAVEDIAKRPVVARANALWQRIDYEQVGSVDKAELTKTAIANDLEGAAAMLETMLADEDGQSTLDNFVAMWLVELTKGSVKDQLDWFELLAKSMPRKPVPKLDEEGNPVLDENGNPVRSATIDGRVLWSTNYMCALAFSALDKLCAFAEGTLCASHCAALLRRAPLSIDRCTRSRLLWRRRRRRRKLRRSWRASRSARRGATGCGRRRSSL
jgi:hypothetical protein